MIAEICRGPKFLDAFLAQTPSIFALKVVFGELLPVPKLCKKNYAQRREQCFEQKTSICNAKFGDLGVNEDRG